MLTPPAEATQDGLGWPMDDLIAFSLWKHRRGKIVCRGHHRSIG